MHDCPSSCLCNALVRLLVYPLGEGWCLLHTEEAHLIGWILIASLTHPVSVWMEFAFLDTLLQSTSSHVKYWNTVPKCVIPPQCQNHTNDVTLHYSFLVSVQWKVLYIFPNFFSITLISCWLDRKKGTAWSTAFRYGHRFSVAELSEKKP